MKITIELVDYEVKDIKRPTKADVQRFVAGEINSLLQAPQCAVADYVQQERAKIDPA